MKTSLENTISITEKHLVYHMRDLLVMKRDGDLSPEEFKGTMWSLLWVFGADIYYKCRRQAVELVNDNE